jgi:hypothetical protein
MIKKSNFYLKPFRKYSGKNYYAEESVYMQQKWREVAFSLNMCCSSANSKYCNDFAYNDTLLSCVGKSKIDFFALRKNLKIYFSHILWSANWYFRCVKSNARGVISHTYYECIAKQLMWGYVFLISNITV